jgi:hypothetical protein
MRICIVRHDSDAAGSSPGHIRKALFSAAGKQEISGKKELTMNRILTLTSSALFAAGLAALPISAFAQQTGPASKTNTHIVSPVTQTGSAPVTKQTIVSKDIKTTHAQRASTSATKQSTSNSKVAAPTTDQPTGSPPTAQHKTPDQSKS